MNKLNKDIEFNGDDLVKSVESFASTLPTKIEYLKTHNNPDVYSALASHGYDAKKIKREVNNWYE